MGLYILPLRCQRLNLVNTSDKAYSTQDSTDRMSGDSPVYRLPVPSPSGAKIGDVVNRDHSKLVILNLADSASAPDHLALSDVIELVW